MAKIGLRNFRYGLLTEATDGTPSYGAAQTPAKAVSCKVDISNNDAKLYADDGLAESDTSFQSGTVTLGVDDEDDQTLATLLGHQIDENGEMVRNADDVAPYVGLGRIITKMVNNVYKYKVEFLHKVKFAEPSQDNTTKGESVEFGTSELSGQVSKLANGDWSKTQTFDSMAEAQEYLNGLFGSPSPVGTQYTVTYNANGGTGTVAPVTVDAGESVTLNDGTGLTAPTSKEFAGWATTDSATVADVTSPYTPSADITLYAVWVDAT
jgi:phi13 family phage major tail protein